MDYWNSLAAPDLDISAMFIAKRRPVLRRVLMRAAIPNDFGI